MDRFILFHAFCRLWYIWHILAASYGHFEHFVGAFCTILLFWYMLAHFGTICTFLRYCAFRYILHLSGCFCPILDISCIFYTLSRVWFSFGISIEFLVLRFFTHFSSILIHFCAFLTLWFILDGFSTLFHFTYFDTFGVFRLILGILVHFCDLAYISHVFVPFGVFFTISCTFRDILCNLVHFGPS